MLAKYLKEKFIQFCYENKLELNINQIKILESLIKLFGNKIFFFEFLFNSKKKLAFYLFGDVEVGKTMILNFFYNNIDIPKHKTHFNEFMINFHDYAHKFKKNNKDINFIDTYAKELRGKYELIYFDEFQVTNIVDAMILGKLFKSMFKEKMKVIITSNTKIEELYKDGLQREQFIPFIHIIKKFSLEKELVISEDYRKSGEGKLDRFFYPLNEHTTFKVNQFFRKLTKGKEFSEKIISIKGRDFYFKKFFEKIARFDFNDLCEKNLGSEDYIKISEECIFITIDNIPKFSDENADKQQRFITLIDILYEKNIPLLVSSSSKLDSMGSSKRLIKPFKRTVSRLYELTTSNNFGI